MLHLISKKVSPLGTPKYIDCICRCPFWLPLLHFIFIESLKKIKLELYFSHTKCTDLSKEGVTRIPKVLPRTRSQTDGRRLSLCKVLASFSEHVCCKIVRGRSTFSCFTTDCCQILLNVLEGTGLCSWLFCTSYSDELERNDQDIGCCEQCFLRMRVPKWGSYLKMT